MEGPVIEYGIPWQTWLAVGCLVLFAIEHILFVVLPWHRGGE